MSASLAQTTRPAVTIVMSFRERWGLTLQSIESIASHTSAPFELWLLDSGMPQALRQALDEAGQAIQFKVIDIGPDAWPNHGRAQVAPEIATPYAVFIDNDVLVESGWLDHLVACAEETGAGIVGPLYLWGSDGTAHQIHMAGGNLVIEEEAGRKVMRESHRHFKVPLADVESSLVREPCGFAEYHCMLMRREVFASPDVFDPDIVALHDHIHASLIAKGLGFDTWLEPKARVNYLAFAPWDLGSLPRFRQRWSQEAGERSLQKFMARWQVIDDDRSMGGVRSFLRSHLNHVDPLDARPLASATRGTEMQAGDLQQTLAGVLALAQRGGYSMRDATVLGQGVMLAMRLSHGMYRPCGRPFLNHLIGTASVLLFYGFSIRMVLAGLLHSAFSHGASPATRAADEAIRKLFEQLGSVGPRVAGMVERYDQRESTYKEFLGKLTSAGDLNLQLSETLLLEAANDIDMHLSLEVAATARTDVAKGPVLDWALASCEAVGVPAMARSVRQARQAIHSLPSIRFSGTVTGSFFLGDESPTSAVRERRARVTR
jgi:hypothetical protein